VPPGAGCCNKLVQADHRYLRKGGEVYNAFGQRAHRLGDIYSGLAGKFITGPERGLRIPAPDDNVLIPKAPRDGQGFRRGIVEKPQRLATNGVL